MNDKTMKDYKHLFDEPRGEYPRAVVITLLVLGVVMALLYAMHGDQEALKAGLIH